MRLSTIKLAGFKSFVDPTVLHLPTNLTGVVGPNGCGKSNIIDAVRWVMGESAASRLRGDSLTDVIFNGSSGRKPVGQAMVELIFDNSDSFIGGEFAAYAEISVKRVVSRDGQSGYYLNQSRCRRRDITDLFLGTGLGARSYSIIEQGMVSQIVESAPEDLRGTAFGFFNLVSGVALLFASGLAGLIWDRFGASFTFLTGTLFCMIALVMIAAAPSAANVAAEQNR